MSRAASSPPLPRTATAATAVFTSLGGADALLLALLLVPLLAPLLAPPWQALGAEPVVVLTAGAVDPTELALLQQAVDDAAMNGAGARSALQPPAPGGCATAALETTLAQADRAERDFDLDAALTAYREGCACGDSGALSDEAWSLWERTCEGGARTAYGLGDAGAMDEQLTALLTARPDRALEAARFPPEVIARAAEIASVQRRGTLRVAGASVTVSLDGVARGVTPLLLDDVSTGPHVVGCGTRTLAVEVTAGLESALACPPWGGGEEPRQLLLQLHGAGLCWVLVGDGPGWAGMEPGVWVFHGGTAPVGLRVGPVPSANEVQAWEQAVVRVRTDGGAD